MPGCSLLDFQKCAITCKTILVLCIPKPLLFQRPSSKIMYISTRRRRLMRGWKRGLGERQWWVQPHGGLHAPSPRCRQPCHLPRPSCRHQLSNDILFSKNNRHSPFCLPAGSIGDCDMESASQPRPISYCHVLRTLFNDITLIISVSSIGTMISQSSTTPLSSSFCCS